MHPGSRVTTDANLFDYFHDHVEQARNRRRLEISDDTGLYLATLLADRTRSDRPAPPEETLAELHAAAAQAPPAKQASTYRELGDRALYLLGYFAESLQRRLVGPAYYAEMGVAAYHRVDLLFKVLFSDAFGPVFGELSREFRGCVDVLSDIRDAHRRDHPNELMQLYTRWLETGDKAVEAELRERGLLLKPLGLAES